MSKQLKFLQVSTFLRAGINPEKISHKRFDDLLSEKDDDAKEELIRGVQALMSGEVRIVFGIKKVVVGGRIFKPQR